MEQATAKQSYFMDQAFEMVLDCVLTLCIRITLTLEQARKALDTGETPVGCVLVYENEIVGRGMNDTNRSMNVGPLYIPSTDTSKFGIHYFTYQSFWLLF